MRKPLLNLLTLVLVFVSLSWSLYKPDAPSFKNQVFPLIQSKCNMKECHADRGGGAPYTSHEAIKLRGKKIVKRITNINGIMPPIQSGIKLSVEEKNLIKTWVEMGMPNN